jgi:hypothetical protein
MRSHQCFSVISGLLLGFCAALGAADTAQGQNVPAQIVVWDTGKPSAPRQLADDWTRIDAWKKIARRQQPSSFQGDAVLTNGRVVVVVRKDGKAIDLYSLSSPTPVWRAQLGVQSPGGDPATRLSRVALVENTRAAAQLEIEYETATGDSATASFRLKRGEIAVEVAPGPGAGLLRVESPSRYVVMPDFFADDILIDATKISASSAAIPSENFVLHMTGDDDAIAMCVFENSDQDVRITFSGEADRRIVSGSEIRFGNDGKIWVALLTGTGIWHAIDVRDEQAGEILPLDWKMPFAAQWRVDFTRNNDLTDSWEMLYPAEDGSDYIKPSWLPSGPQGGQPSLTATGEIDVDAYKVGGPASNRLGPDRERWITVLGKFQYPCWTDTEQHGFIQPLKSEVMTFHGPALLYPINRLPETPVETFTTVDVVRGTLGVGPCEYILSVEGQRQDHVGRATCHVRRLLNEIYEEQQQLAKQEEIEHYLADAMDFVVHIRDRISLYVEFGQEMRRYLATQIAAHPEFEKSLTELDNIVQELDQKLEARRDAIKSAEYVEQLNDGFRSRLLRYEGPDSLDRLKEYTDALTVVGGNQDTLVGQCRWIVRSLRQRAALTMAVDPRFADIATEIRAKTQEVLLKPSAYEGARH